MAQPAEDHPPDRRIGRSLWREPIKATAKGLATSAFYDEIAKPLHAIFTILK